MKIATWNVNSIKARLPNLLSWLADAKPDILLLQELKCQEDGFPRLELQAAGYQALVVGQKAYNGVAILSTAAITPRLLRLPGDASDEQARYVEGETHGLIVASIYLPNGNPVDSEKFPYKLGWMKRLQQHAQALLRQERATILGGDYNAIPAELDCYDPKVWRADALFRPETQAAFRGLVNQGWCEAFRVLNPGKRAYSFWDYQAGAWEQNHGIRIDHLLLSPQAADRLTQCQIDQGPRAKQRASDHTPVCCEIL